MKKILPALLILMHILPAVAQQDLENQVEGNDSSVKEYVSATFKGFRIINAQTIETAKKHNLFFNIAHRFGDIGVHGAQHTLFGFDASTDIRFSFDYGLTDRLQLGVGRSKGIDAYTELYDGNIKFKLLRQTMDNKMPLSITLNGVAAISARPPSDNPADDASYQNMSQRMSYVAQAVMARKFTPWLSIQLMPSYMHRNYVLFAEDNDLFSLGAGARVKITKRVAIISDYFHTFSEFGRGAGGNDALPQHFDPLSIGMEIETGGHVFTINFTNTTGILENSFLPFTKSNWLDGEFRLGFNISRNFVIGGKSW